MAQALNGRTQLIRCPPSLGLEVIQRCLCSIAIEMLKQVQHDIFWMTSTVKKILRPAAACVSFRDFRTVATAALIGPASCG
jgi:hypothetical protein